MAEKKITKREVINAMLNVATIRENEVFKAYLENELALLDKKASNKKPTKVQTENEVLKEVIVANLDTKVGKTVTDLIKSVEELSELSNQKVTALMRQLVLDGKVVKAVDGKKTVFTLPAVDEIEG